MSNLAKVLCFLLMVAATSVSAWNILTPLRTSFTLEMDSFSAKINSAHQYAYSNLSKIMTKVERKSSAESAREYLSEIKQQAVIKCIGEELEVLEDRQRRLNATRLEALHRVKLHKIMAKSCTCMCSFDWFKPFRTHACLKKLLALTASVLKEVELIFSTVVKDMRMRNVRLVKTCRKDAKEAKAGSAVGAIGSAEDQEPSDGNEKTTGE